ncbi:MAG TPA: DUF1778 domain-containing protein [Acetobacteraceae bacterium]|nr:DUF1778 domain-containing protein [Acetobacteraceae bacterium]
MAQLKSPSRPPSRSRDERLGFRVDRNTKVLVERAARLERRSLTDYCLTAVGEAARRTIAQHETLALSARDRATFFEVLMHPPEPSERLGRAFAAEQRRMAQ